MEHNKIKIIDFGENKPADRIYLNGNQLDYVKDFKIVRHPNELAEVTIVLTCKEVEILKRKEEIKLSKTFVNGEKEDFTWQREAFDKCSEQIKEEIKQYVTECMRGVHNESQN